MTMATEKNNLRNKIEYYLNLPWSYTVEITHETGEPLYIVQLNELPGIATDAPTLDEAMKLIKEAMRETFELYIKEGEEIPEPLNQTQYKGNIAYRTTPRRHYLIAREAKKQKLSLSQVIDSLIDVSMGQRKL